MNFTKFLGTFGKLRGISGIFGELLQGKPVYDNLSENSKIILSLCVPFVVVDFSSIGQMKTAAGDCMAYTNTVDICVLGMFCMLNNFDENYSCEKEMVSTFLRDRLF